MGEKLFFKKVFHHHKASFAQQNEPNSNKFCAAKRAQSQTSFAQQNEFHKKSKSKTGLAFLCSHSEKLKTPQPQRETTVLVRRDSSAANTMRWLSRVSSVPERM